MSDRAFRKTMVGRVISDKMDKTIVVAVEDRIAHPLYKRLSNIPISSKRMMRKTNAAWAIRFWLWRPARFPRIRDGAWSR